MSTEPIRCQGCKRPLRAAASIAAGRGPRCLAKARAAALTDAVKDFTPAQVEKALEAIAEGAVVATSRPGIYRCVSSDGSTVYLVAYEGCTCPSGTRGLGRLCWHRAAVRLLAVSRKPVRKAA